MKATISRTSAPFEKQEIVCQWWYFLAIPAILIALTFLIYFSSLSYAFEFDDLANIEKYFNIRHTTLGSIFFKSSRWISYWLNACYYDWLPQSEKFHPFLYRLGNVIFHTTTGLLVFGMFRLIALHATKDRFLHTYGILISYVAAGLFLLHPVQTQTVSYVIQGQLEGLAGLFTVAIVTCFLGSCLLKNMVVRAAVLFLMFVLAVLACGSKEIIIVVPVLVLVVDWFFVAQGNLRSMRGRWGIHGLLFFIIVSLYIYFLKPLFFLNVLGFNSDLPNNIGNVLTDHVNQKITPYYFGISQFKVILHYLFIFIWPFSMSVDYDWKLSRHFLELDCLVPFLVLCVAAMYVGRRLYRNPTDWVSFGILWFLLAVLPRSSIVPSTELLADYKTYIASIGIFFIFSYIWAAVLLGARRFLAYKSNVATTGAIFLISTAFLLCCGFAAYVRNQVWKSPEAFWLNVIANAPSKARAYNNYGVYLCESKKYAESIPYFKKAIQLDNYYADPYNNIAVSYASLEQIDMAIKALQQSLRLMPYHPEIYNNLANMFMQKEDYTNVEKLLQASIQLRPHYGKAHYNLGNYYTKIKEPEKAWQAYKNCCLSADFDNEVGFTHYGHASFLLKKYDEALFAYSRVVEINPEAKAILLNIAHTYFAQKDYIPAERLYREIVMRDPQHINARFQLGQVLQEREQYSKAFEQYSMVQQAKPSFAPVYHRLAYCLAKMGRPKEALQVLNNFIAASPSEEHQKKAKELITLIQDSSINFS